MSAQSSSVSYSREDVLEVLRTLEELVVSLDQIGSACAEMSRRERDAVLSAFIQDHDIFRKVGTARGIMSSAFSDEVGADGMQDLERVTQDVPYWTAAEARTARSGGDV